MLAMITDTHFGVRNDAPEFLDNQIEFYETTFFPELNRRGVKSILHLGDIFDRRKHTNHNMLHRIRESFFDKLVEYDIVMYLIVGNHDTYFKSTNRVASPVLLLDKYKNHIRIIEEPTEISFDDTPLLFIPWINRENYDETMDIMKNSNAGVCLGHFEISGFEMHRGGGVNVSGLSTDIFSNFHTVFSGHFHEPSTDGHVTYLGAPSQYTWADFDCTRGFYFYDPANNELEYVLNPHNMFYRIIYDGSIDVKTHDYSQYNGKIVRIIVSEKNDDDTFEDFICKIEDSGVHTLEVVDNSEYHIDTEDIDDEAIKNEDTLGIVTSYVDKSDVSLEKPKLNAMFKSLYVEALSL